MCKYLMPFENEVVHLFFLQNEALKAKICDQVIEFDGILRRNKFNVQYFIIEKSFKYTIIYIISNFTANEILSIIFFLS